MEKNVYEKEKELKEKAIKYFKDFFDEDGKLKNNTTVDELHNKYLYYCEEYFTKFDDESNKIKMDIKNGYEYVFYIIDGKLNYIDSKELTAKLLDSYNGLVRRIGDYRFKKTKEGSYGEKQNNANDTILMNISNLKSIVYEIVNNINIILEKYDKNNQNIFSIDITRKLNELRNRLISQSIELDKARNNYYKSLKEKHISLETSFSKIGNDKKVWRQKKNEACSEILFFVKTLNDINKSIAEYYMSLDKDEQNINFNSCSTAIEGYVDSTKRIRKSKEYYSFLSETERENLTKENKIKKLKRKR